MSVVWFVSLGVTDVKMFRNCWSCLSILLLHLVQWLFVGVFWSLHKLNQSEFDHSHSLLKVRFVCSGHIAFLKSSTNRQTYKPDQKHYRSGGGDSVLTTVVSIHEYRFKYYKLKDIALEVRVPFIFSTMEWSNQNVIEL